MGTINSLWRRLERLWRKSGQNSGPELKQGVEGGAKFALKRSLAKETESQVYSLLIDSGEELQQARISLYRFLIDNIPALNAAVWTWISMSSSAVKFEIVGSEDQGKAGAALEAVGSLFRRVYDNRYQKFAGVEALLNEYYAALFSCGAVAGEVVGQPAGEGLDYFYFIDPASLGFELQHGFWRIYQKQGQRKIWLERDSCYFCGLRADSINPWGNSLLRSVPFAARVEQQLLNDMHRSMRNAGYHRIHVKIHPPDRLAGEAEDNYIARANNYFEKTAGMFRDFRPEDNPITWDDVQIEYIGPASKVSGSNSWYLNHRTIIEDICAGMHLAPFMLGYSYGTTHNWAMFKYELVQREVRAVQACAAGFLEWLANLELALKGFQVSCRIRFENEIIYGLKERMEAEEIRIKTIIMKREAGLINQQVAEREAETGRVGQ